MKKKILIRIAVATAVLLTATGGYALGSGAPFTIDSSQPFYGCVTGVNGNITKVSNTPKTCPRGSVSITWNLAGPTGAKGDKGDTGNQGPQGAQGVPGVGSSNAAAYIESPDGSTRYPIYSFNNANWVKIDGNVYQITGQTLTPQVVNLGYQLMYASSDCSGHPKLVKIVPTTTPQVTKLGPPIKDLIVSLAGVIGKASLSETTTIQDIGSWDVSGTCRTANLGEIYSDFNSQKANKLAMYQAELSKPYSWYLPDPSSEPVTSCDVPTVLLDSNGNPDMGWWNWGNPVGRKSMTNCVWNEGYWTTPLGFQQLTLANDYRVDIYDFQLVTPPNLSGWQYVIG